MKSRKTSRLFLGSLAAVGLLELTASCASAPQESLQERPATEASLKNKVTYKIPEIAPLGRLRIQNFGLTTFQAPGSMQKIKTIHMLLAVTNLAKDGCIEIGSKALSISFSNGSNAQAVFANPDAIRVQPGGGHMGMDLYFPVPKELLSAQQVQDFDLHWQVTVVDQNYAQTTAFSFARPPNGPLDEDLLSLVPEEGLPYDIPQALILGPAAGWW